MSNKMDDILQRICANCVGTSMTHEEWSFLLQELSDNKEQQYRKGHTDATLQTKRECSKKAMNVAVYEFTQGNDKVALNLRKLAKDIMQ